MRFKRHLSDYRDELIETLEDMRGKEFIVEGKKDVRSLALFGILDVHYLKGKGIYEFCETLDKNRKYVILTDFDPEGERIAKKLEEYMRENGIKVDRNARIRLRRLFIKNNLNTIQGIRNLI